MLPKHKDGLSYKLELNLSRSDAGGPLVDTDAGVSLVRNAESVDHCGAFLSRINWSLRGRSGLTAVQESVFTF